MSTTLTEIEQLKDVPTNILCDMCKCELDEYTAQKNMVASWTFCDTCSEELFSDLDDVNRRQFGEHYLLDENPSPAGLEQVIAQRLSRPAIWCCTSCGTDLRAETGDGYTVIGTHFYCIPCGLYHLFGGPTCVLAEETPEIPTGNRGVLLNMLDVCNR